MLIEWNILQLGELKIYNHEKQVTPQGLGGMGRRHGRREFLLTQPITRCLGILLDANPIKFFFQNIYKDGFLMSFVVVVSNTPHDDFKESSF